MVVMVRPSVLSCERRVGCQRLAVNYEVEQRLRFSHLLVAGEHLGHTLSQMQIAAMGSDQEGVPLLIVQQHQRTAARNLAESPNQPARNQGLSVDRFAMPIHVKMR